MLAVAGEGKLLLDPFLLLNYLFVSADYMKMLSYICMAGLVVVMVVGSSPTDVKGNILVLAMPGYSRWLGVLNVARELKTYGYSTTFVIPEGKDKLLAGSGIEVITSKNLTKFESIFYNEIAALGMSHGFSGSSPSLSTFMKFGEFCSLIAGDEDLIQTLQKRKFGIAIIDTVFVTLCTCVIPYRLSIPFVHFGRDFLSQRMRILIHPSAYPAVPVLPITDKMTYLQRLENAMVYIFELIAPDLFNPSDVVGMFAPNMPHITNEELQAKTVLYLLDTDELIDYHLPTYPNMKYVGGVTTRPADPLTGDVKLFMDSAENGAVVVSFGSIVNTLPDDLFEKLIPAFRRRPNLSFVFRYGNKTKLDGNLLLMPWLPQNDLLGHTKTKLFISHCGNSGQFEALYHAVPTICLPVFAEQPYNAARMQSKGYGIHLNVATFTANDLTSAIDEILTRPMYKQNIMKASTIFQNRMLAPAKRAAWWIDHVIKYGGQHLHPTVADLPYYQFLLIDVLAGVLALLMILFFICYIFFKCMCRVLGKTKQKTD